jgi:signal transduction histidine kinase
MKARPVSASSINAFSHSQATFWRGLAISVMLVTIGFMILYVIFALQFRNTAFPGFILTYTGTVGAALPVSGTDWQGDDAGLQRGDYLIAVNDQPIADSHFPTTGTNFRSLLATLSPDTTISIDFQRRVTALAPIPDADPTTEDAPNGLVCRASSDTLAECRTQLTLSRFPDGDFLAYFVLPFVASLFMIGIGGLVIWLRADTREGFLAVLITCSTAIFSGGLFDVGSTIHLVPVWIFAAVTVGAALMNLGLTFPVPLRFMIQMPVLRAVPFIVAWGIGAYFVWNHANPASPWDNNATQYATTFSVIGLLALLLLQWTQQRPRAITSIARDQFLSITIGGSLMLIPAIVWILNRILTTTGIIIPLNLESLMPLYVFPTAAIAYATLQTRRLDADRLITQATTYLLMTIALMIAIYLLTLGLSLLARDLFNISDPLVIAIILFFMVLFFAPFRNAIQRRIDEIYFRTRRNYLQQVEEFGQKLASLSRYEDIMEEFRLVLHKSVAPASIFIFIARREGEEYGEVSQLTDVRFSRESATVSVMGRSEQIISLQPGQPFPQDLLPDRARLQILRAAILAPLSGSAQLNGFVVMSMPRSGKQGYTFEEMRFINNLISQFSISTERSLVIGSLQRRVSELDVLSRVGQAVNFVLEFDDLLELISNQTGRLTDARYFYIVLYDDALQQLSFAFFLEDDERYADKENRRWALDNGLFSEVIQTGKPLRVTNYIYEMKLRAAQLHFESSDLRAWMGVPLTAGRRTMGVLAAARAFTDEGYTDEQFKIFSNIGELAATSIDKASLFTETRRREKQMTVLNDITRQLVASESDVEKLLKLIMASSVEILDAEAGSLLLTAEDGSGDLEFRVVVGGDSALVGKRMTAGEGIVGQVAKTGDSYISKDAIADPRHATSASAFQTTSLLAVPLVAKDRVVGVLEVLNKKDGTSFTQGDSELLNAFASQAAVAIENARLLRMTDIQLAQRVKELETLEQIDNELNRTLNLQQVATITVRQALKTLNAQAGALGMVKADEGILQVVAIEGYSPDEYPQGSNGFIWSLNEGIIKRVMRTRSPDLAADLSIDPDYEPGLSDSLSQITLPMFSGNDINAILILEKSAKPAFTLPDWLFAQRLAEHASIAISNAQLYEALMSANESKSEFMGFAAHELKNPLTPIKTGTDLIRSGMLGALSDPLTNIINMVYHNSELMERIINDLRDAARMDANKFHLDPLKPVSMRHVIDVAALPYLRKIEDVEQVFINDISDELPKVFGDEQRLIQVFGNLISNANKYSEPETTIRVTGDMIKSHTDAQGKRRGEMVRIAIIDQGLGMKPEDVARLGKESYFRSTNEEAKQKEGTGLGMKLTFGIIQSHDGDVQIESELGKGTTFYIYLPLAPVEEKPIERNKVAQPEPAAD